MLAMAAAWARDDATAIAALNADYLSTRESAELRAASVQMGFSLCALMSTLPDLRARIVSTLRAIQEPTLPCAWSAATTAWEIEPRESVMGYLWTWAENQVLVAMKAVPIGQSAGQRVLVATGSRIAQGAADIGSGAAGAAGAAGALGTAGTAGTVGSGGAVGTGDIGDELGEGYSNFTPGLAILSSQHETQYSRLFRS